MPRGRSWGHGFNNQAVNPERPSERGKGTVHHEELVAEALRHFIKMYKQSAHSPELNRMDLGVWYALHAAVEAHYKDFEDTVSLKLLLDAVWEVVKEEFWALDPKLLFVISLHKKAMAEAVIAAGGDKIKKDPHSGSRKRARQLIKDAYGGPSPMPQCGRID